MNKNILLICLCLMIVFCPSANAQVAGEGDGVLNQQTINITNEDSFFSQVMASIGSFFTSFTVDPLQPLNDTSRDGLTNDALSFLGLSPAQVTNFNSQDIYLNSLFDFDTDTSINQAPGTVWIGDINDPGSIVVITGQLDIITTNTTTENRLYELSLTGDLIDGQEPGPIGNAAVPEPSTIFLFGSGLLGAFIRKRK